MRPRLGRPASSSCWASLADRRNMAVAGIAAVAQRSPHDVVHGSGYTVVPGAACSSAQHVDLRGTARRLAAGCRHLVHDGRRGVAPQLLRAQAVLLQDVPRRVHPREGVQEMLDTHIAGAVKKSRVVGGVAACQHRFWWTGIRPSRTRRQGPARLPSGVLADARRMRRAQNAKSRRPLLDIPCSSNSAAGSSPLAGKSDTLCFKRAKSRRPNNRQPCEKGRHEHLDAILARRQRPGWGWVACRSAWSMLGPLMPKTPTSAPWPRCGASAAIFRGAEVLLVQRGKGALSGLWSLPGGHIEPGERTQDAALREVGRGDRDRGGTERPLGHPRRVPPR